ncbi:MAG: hypothetical protein R2706_00250 [Acidimicrobiales bacterium]
MMNATFKQLHQSGTFLLVNVHDVGAAVLAEAAGAAAVATTSAGPRTASVARTAKVPCREVKSPSRLRR